jgi:hypothetical protein
VHQVIYLLWVKNAAASLSMDRSAPGSVDMVEHPADALVIVHVPLCVSFQAVAEKKPKLR